MCAWKDARVDWSAHCTCALHCTHQAGIYFLSFSIFKVKIFTLINVSNISTCNGPAQHSVQHSWPKISLDTTCFLFSLLVKIRLVVTQTWVVFPHYASAAPFGKVGQIEITPVTSDSPEGVSTEIHPSHLTWHLQIFQKGNIRKGWAVLFSPHTYMKKRVTHSLSITVITKMGRI